MPAVARGDGIDTVTIIHDPGTTETFECSTDVFVNGYGVVREDDQVAAHSPHNPPYPRLTTYSSTVLVNGKGVGRIGDQYACGATIATGSSNIFIG